MEKILTSAGLTIKTRQPKYLRQGASQIDRFTLFKELGSEHKGRLFT
jgi:hypothetical protein